MERLATTPRRNYQEKVRLHGLLWETTEEGPYWNESAYYQFSMAEVLRIEKASNDLHKMCLAAAERVIEARDFRRFGIPESVDDLIVESWETEPPSLYGRFDLAYTFDQEIKLLEYNADTPTSLLETAVIQWYWLQDKWKGKDQFNSLHERLVALWKELTPYLKGDIVHFTSSDNAEDAFTVGYLRETAIQAGLKTAALPMEAVGLRHSTGAFVDLENREIQSIFKLYPWEWMVHEPGRDALLSNRNCQWMEPIWKMVLSNKAILAVLWEMYPNHPLLLETYCDQPKALMGHDYVQKPKMSREGKGVAVYFNGKEICATDAEGYGEEGYVFQKFAPIRSFAMDSGPVVPVLGSWMIGHEADNAAGMGIRESAGLITDNAEQVCAASDWVRGVST